MLGRGLDTTGSGWGLLAGLNDDGDEPSCCKNDGKFLVLLSTYHLPKLALLYGLRVVRPS